MNRFDARTLAEATGGVLLREAPAGPVWTDTRTLPAGAWFLALKGPRFDGHEHVAAALAAGAVGAIVETGRTAEGEGEGGLVRVADGLRAFQDLGAFARSRFTGPVVGLTGSSGKTTTRALTALALSPLGEVHQTVGNLNNHLGVPMTLLAAPATARAMVVEMGTSSPGEIARLAEIATPDVRLIVNVGPAHLEELGGLEGVAYEKTALFRTALPGDTVVVNTLDPFLARTEAPDGVRRITVGGEGADVRVLSAVADPDRLVMAVRFATPEGELEVELPAFGSHFALDAALAIGAAWAVGADLRASVAALAGYAPVGMRMRVEADIEGVRVFNDAYNANPASMRASLDALAGLTGRKVAVLGDMLELGPGEDRYHTEVVAHADSLGLDLLVLVGPRMGRAARGAVDTEVWTHEDRGEAGARLAAWLVQGDQVLLKGSRGARTEDVLAALRAARENR